MKDQLVQIADLAAKRNLPFLLVGGHAVILHGVPRFTRDIDIMTTDEWRDEWRELIEDLGYRKFHAVDAFEQFEPDPEQSATTSRVGIDLMFVDASTWEKLYPAADDIDLQPDVRAKIPNVLHLIAMKLNAARSPHRRIGATDLSDVIELISAAKIDIESSAFREIAERYASAEDLAAIRDSSIQSETD